jgi:exodeoxyribonuclease VII large subunit
LLVRGGGSIEDLWAFNDAGLAQAVFEARTPIVTGVGHETDFTIVDFVADTRAPTPSAAAEVATPDLSTLVATLHDQRQRLRITLVDRLRTQREDVRDITRTLTLLSPASDIRNYRQRLDDLRTGIDRQQTYSLQRQRERLQAQVAALHAASPQAILQRGYAFVTDAQGNPVQQVTDTTVGDPINIHLQDGTLAATVTDRNEAS